MEPSSVKKIFFFMFLIFVYGALADQPFAIKHNSFIDRSILPGNPSYAALQASGNKLLIQAIPPGIPVLKGKDTLWGHGSIHTWLGKDNSIYGYVFSSEDNDPLQFRVDRD